MSRIELTIVTDAPVARVWQALCAADEVPHWDSSIIEALDAPPDYPQPGQEVRWRLRTGPYNTLIDKPQEVEPERKLRALLEIGPIKIDETYTLTPLDAGCRVDLVIDWTAPMLIASLAGNELRKGFESSMAGLKRWCEGDQQRIENG